MEFIDSKLTTQNLCHFIHTNWIYETIFYQVVLFVVQFFIVIPSTIACLQITNLKSRHRRAPGSYMQVLVYVLYYYFHMRISIHMMAKQHAFGVDNICIGRTIIQMIISFLCTPLYFITSPLWMGAFLMLLCGNGVIHCQTI